jgi:hypothetical protein
MTKAERIKHMIDVHDRQVAMGEMPTIGTEKVDYLRKLYHVMLAERITPKAMKSAISVELALISISHMITGRFYHPECN